MLVTYLMVNTYTLMPSSSVILDPSVTLIWSYMTPPTESYESVDKAVHSEVATDCDAA